MAVPVQGRDARGRARRRSADDAADQRSSARCSSTRTRWPRPRASSAATSPIPELELGAAYDEAMATRVFDPLGMTATTFDFARALAGNHAGAHAPDIDGKPARAVMDLNYAVIPVRPAGGAWSTVRDMLKYVQMELDEGTLPGGKRYIAKEALLARRDAAGPDRQGRDLRDGPHGRHEVRHPRRAPRRRPDRLPQRHDVAARVRTSAP